jgi:hypothetical protein
MKEEAHEDVPWMNFLKLLVGVIGEEGVDVPCPKGGGSTAYANAGIGNTFVLEITVETRRNNRNREYRCSVVLADATETAMEAKFTHGEIRITFVSDNFVGGNIRAHESSWIGSAPSKPFAELRRIMEMSRDDYVEQRSMNYENAMRIVRLLVVKAKKLSVRDN